MPSVEGVVQVTKEQLRMTRQKGREVKVSSTLFPPNPDTNLIRYAENHSYRWLWTIRIPILVFKGYTSKRGWTWRQKYRAGLLKITVGRIRGTSSPPLLLMTFSNRSTAVACGAVIRTLRKEDGPARILQSSYGFLRIEPYGRYKEHASQRPKRDKIDGIDYIDNAIDWIINKVGCPVTFNPFSSMPDAVQGDELDSEAVEEREVEYTFGLRKDKFLCIESLYVSDRRHD